MAETVTIKLLGGVEIRGGAAPVSSRAVAVLAYLVSRPRTPQPRAHLAGVFWPESDAAQARTNLRRELHHLRSLLGDTGCLSVAAGALCWQDGPGCEVDLHGFLVARERCATALLADDAEAVAQESAQALACYQGPFLPGLLDDWALDVRQDLQRACVDLCDRVVSFWAARDDPDAGLVPARRRIQLEPLEEYGYRQLMHLQRASRDRAGAMRTYHRCASLLERELGVAPSDETRAAFDATLAEGTSRATNAAADRLPWSSTPLMVGRDGHRRRLRQVWEEAHHGCRFMLVTGAAGVGKTRLVTELAGDVRRQDGAVASARCFAATASLPLAPVAEWLRSPHLRLATKRLDAVWRGEVERLVPGADGSSDLGTGPRAKVDAWQRLRFFEGLVRAAVAVDRPLLLTLDDLQWCDKSTVSWLSFLLSSAGAAPVLVVATAREDELGGSEPAGLLSTMRASGQVTTMGLTTLSGAETDQLAQQVLGRPVGSDELQLLQTVTAGNPFYVIEALREAMSTPGPVQPGHVRGVLGSRLSRLSDPARAVALLASAVGRDFSLDLLLEASDLDADAAVRVVDDLWHQRIFDQQGRDYDFTHDLLRQAAYDSMSPPERWLSHRRLAQALELLHADQRDDVAAQLAEQYDRSGHPARALPFYDRAAGQATSVFAHAEAVRMWQRCVELVGEMPPSRQRDERELAVLQQLLPPLNAWRGYASRQLEAAERRTAELGQRLHLVDTQTSASIALFATTFVQGHTAEAHRWGQRAIELAERCPELAAQAHLAFAGSGLSLGLVQLADEHFQLACRLAGDTDSLPIGTRTEVHARGWWAHARWLRGDVDGAAAAADEAVQRARLIEHPYSLAVALSYGAITHQVRGDPEALALVLSELGDLCERYAFAYYREWAVVLSGWLRGGSAGVQKVRDGIAALEQEGSLARMPYWLWLLADLHRGEGQDDAAVAVLDAATASATERDDRWWLPEVLRTRASLDPTGRADGTLARATAMAAEQGSTALLDRCRADLEAHRFGSR